MCLWVVHTEIVERSIRKQLRQLSKVKLDYRAELEIKEKMVSDLEQQLVDLLHRDNELKQIELNLLEENEKLASRIAMERKSFQNDAESNPSKGGFARRLAT